MLVCSYCGNEKADWMLSCCGENHWVEAEDNEDAEDNPDSALLAAAKETRK